MSQGAKNIHLVLVLVYRRERGFAIANFLKSMKLEVIIANTLYEGLKICAQEMPHLIITESKLSDGSCVSLFDRLKAHPYLRAIPILVFEKKSQETTAYERPFAGILEEQNAGVFKEKISDILEQFARVSPYFIPVDNLPPELSKPIDLLVPARILGQAHQHIVIESAMEIDCQANMRCLPNDSRYESISLELAHNLFNKTSWYNLFPIHRIRSKGRQWIENLPDLGPAEGAKSVIFCDSEPMNYQRYRQLVAGYGINLVHAASLKDAAEMSENLPGEFSTIFLSYQSLANPQNRLEAGVARPNLPPLIVPKTVIARASTSKLRFIKQPCSLGTIIDMLRIGSISLGGLKRNIDRIGFSGVKANLVSAAMLLGLDETGGVLEASFPIAMGSQIEIESENLKEIFGGKKTVTIESFVNVGGNRWHLHFRSLPKGTSKSIYYMKLQNNLSEP